ncbi:Subtilisin-like serine endopeptidase family protein [Striga hermonthica]|uniref:Subtilisin-like serine endopeptidase family protein n=1 Tax=Striga hermonthica TaxID=68872 RepID=A0A9N7RMG6_STRHE|nr:Subtilisin-like serine endopeptidase family protein [Striga hermonthica]
MPKPFVNHREWYSSTIQSLNTLSDPKPSNKPENELSLLYIYDNVLHGYSALLSNLELEALKKSTGFISAYPDRTVRVDTTHTPEFLSLNNSTGLWPASNYGEDVIVGVIDTGVWPESKSFRDDGMTEIPKRWKGVCQAGQDFDHTMCNKKLIGVRYFNKGVLAKRYPNKTLSMNSGRDTIGHGTHTTSTAAGNEVTGASFFGYAPGKAKGIATRARVAMYKVIWDEGATVSDMIAGMDAAVADGVDVISISLGVPNVSLYEDPVAIASFGAMEKGVFVSSSAGNNGPSPGSLHNGIPWVLTVGAGSVDRSFGGTLTLGNGKTIRGWTMFPAQGSMTKYPLIYDKTLSRCNSSANLSSAAAGGIVICEKGYVFDYQVSNVSSSNASGAIIISDDPATFEFAYYYASPIVVISSRQAQALINYATNGVNPVASIMFQQTFLGTKPAPVAATYTSRGPSQSYPGVLKPDLMAPGSLVLASWVTNKSLDFITPNLSRLSDFTIISGTSMACPHASGVAALLKGAHPDWSSAAIRSAMMTTANPQDNTGNRIRDEFVPNGLASPLAMGAGQVDPNRALNPGLVYDLSRQDYVNLVCSMKLNSTQIKTIVRSNYNCSTPSSDLNYPSFIALFSTKKQGMMLTKKFHRTVTYVGGNGKNATKYYVKIKAPKNTNITVCPKILVFQKMNEKRSYSLTIHYEVRNTTAHGSITWIDEFGDHSVRSPIVVTPQVHN